MIAFSLSACSNGDSEEATAESSGSDQESASTQPTEQSPDTSDDATEESSEPSESAEDDESAADGEVESATTVDEVKSQLLDDWISEDGQAQFEIIDATGSVAPEIDVEEESEHPGRFFIHMCTTGDDPSECVMADSIFLTYYPAGDAPTCEEQIEGTDFTECDPDYTDEHDTSQPRLTWNANHQHNEKFTDAVPLYRHEIGG